MLLHYRNRIPKNLEPCNPIERMLAEQVLPAKLAQTLPLPVLMEQYEKGYMQHPDLLEELTETVEARLTIEEQRAKAAGSALMFVSHRAEHHSSLVLA